MSTIQILYDGEDITDNVTIAETQFTSRANGADNPGDCTVIFRDVAQAFRFTPGKTLELFIDGSREWDGYLVQQSFYYWFESHSAECSPCPHITPRKIILTGVDRNVLLNARVSYNKTDLTDVRIPTWPAGTMDRDLILDCLADYTDGLDGIDISTRVEEVAAYDPYAEFQVPVIGFTIGDLLTNITNEVGTVYYIDPDRYLVYTDVNEPSAPFAISDQPSGSEVGCREFKLLRDGSNMVNDAFIWGAGYGSDEIIYARSTDSASIAAHGRWQKGEFRSMLWRQQSAERMAESIVYGSPSNRRGAKDEQPTVTCVIYEPGIRAGQKVAVTSAVFSYSDVLPVREVRMTFPTSTDVRYDLRLAHHIDKPWTTVDPWVPQRRIDPPPPSPSCTKVVPTRSMTAVGLGGSTPDASTLSVPAHNVQQGFTDWFVTIEGGINKFVWYGDDNYYNISYTNANAYTRYTYINADKFWYTFGSAGMDVPGERIRSIQSQFEQFTTMSNTLHPELGVYAHIVGTIELSGIENDRNMVGGGIFGPSLTGEQPFSGPHYIQVGVITPGPMPYEPNILGSPFIEVGGAISGDSFPVDTWVHLDQNTTYFIYASFNEIPVIGDKPWLRDIQVVANVGVLEYNLAVPVSYSIPADADGLGCLSVPGTGRLCETPVLLFGNVYRLHYPYIAGSTRVTVDGLAISGYTESAPGRGEITLNEEPLSPPYVCYWIGDTPASLAIDETLLVPSSGRISGSFGAQTALWPSWYWHGEYYEHFHNGVDFAVATGTPVVASHAGTVRYEDQAAGGTMINLYHADGYRTLYAHLSERLVADGQPVAQGQLIGLSGATGDVTGAHLHWGLVWRGSFEDPLPYSNFQPTVL